MGTNVMVNREKIEFADSAAKYFSMHPEKSTFTKGNIEADAYFAVRWGVFDDCVLVFRIGDDPINFIQFIEHKELQYS